MTQDKNQLPAKLSGQVRHYAGNGRKLGYPTANIASNTQLPDGVYFGYAELGKYTHHPAMIFIGTPTTVGDTERRVEAHLFDAEDIDYYDQQLTVSIEKFHRSNQTFGSVEELQKAMKTDEFAGRAWTQAA